MEKNDFLIPLNGLPQGLSEFGRKIGKEFFRDFDNTEILDAEVGATIRVEKSGRYVGVDSDLCGEVTVECDRCLEPLTLPVEVSIRLSVKYGSEASSEEKEESEPSREVVYLPEDDADLDLSQIIYDYLCLALPPQRFHPDGECNPEVLKYLADGIKVEGKDKTGNPFSVLEGFLADKKE